MSEGTTSFEVVELGFDVLILKHFLCFVDCEVLVWSVQTVFAKQDIPSPRAWGKSSGWSSSCPSLPVPWSDAEEIGDRGIRQQWKEFFFNGRK